MSETPDPYVLAFGMPALFVATLFAFTKAAAIFSELFRALFESP